MLWNLKGHSNETKKGESVKRAWWLKKEQIKCFNASHGINIYMRANKDKVVSKLCRDVSVHLGEHVAQNDVKWTTW